MAFVSIPGHMVFGGKKYKLYKAFLYADEAMKLKRKLKQQGYAVRIYKKAGTMHGGQSHIYIRK